MLRRRLHHRRRPGLPHTDRERLIGDAAKNLVAINPIKTVFDAKRLIDRRFSDLAMQSDMKH